MDKKQERTKPPEKGTEQESSWERFQRLARGVVAVPKEAIKEPKGDKPQTS